MTVETQAPVTISYKDLLARPESLKADIERALGSDEGCLGVILVKGELHISHAPQALLTLPDLPEEFPKLRSNLFQQSARLAALDPSSLAELESPSSSYCFGWSHGKEVMNGRPDTAKGSFYANPLLDSPNVSSDLRAQYPEYYEGNTWPSASVLPDFERDFKAYVLLTGAMLIGTGWAG